MEDLFGLPAFAQGTEADTRWELFSESHHWQWQPTSRRMWFNGILVWLDFASLLADGVLYLSQHDIEHAIEPLMAIRRGTAIEAGDAKAAAPRPKIIIDPAMADAMRVQSTRHFN